ncbi:hypothetical protein NC651_007164 [Populus alba x Populus x berolinensis]|nr:hypothetical protein NC651_007164 [Populus alba x Populus x berolinensis]
MFFLLSILKNSIFFHKKKQTLRFVKAYVSVKQQTYEAKVALIGIGIKGRYSKSFSYQI